MATQNQPPEAPPVSRAGWLRAAVLGTNDGSPSTAKSMAVGAHVAVSSRADTECDDLEEERTEQTSQPEFGKRQKRIIPEEICR